MKTIYPVVVLIISMFTAGCADKEQAEKKARDEAEAKARAEAARKEMQTVPKVFRPQYHNKRLESETPPSTQPARPPEKKP